MNHPGASTAAGRRGRWPGRRAPGGAVSGTPDDAREAALDASPFEAEMEWLAQAIDLRLKQHFADPPSWPALPGGQLPPPALAPGQAYAEFVAGQGLDAGDRLVAALALAPTLRPSLLDVLSLRNEFTQRPYTEFGGVVGREFLPTLQTALFLLAGEGIDARLHALRRLQAADWLAAGEGADGAGAAAAPLALDPAIVAALLGLPAAPAGPGARSPARRLTSGLGWDDLVLPAATLDALDDVRRWIEFGPTLLHDWGLGARLRPGCTVLFHGPPGTGKTLSATLLGQRCGRAVMRIDLSQLVSKYIGETEKNLGRVFDDAQRQGWILFFDEADALFGKRTRVADAHDRYANQEISYLLQRVEDFDGIAILASNLRQNIDDAFARRFQAVIAFALPGAAERERLWREGFPRCVEIEPGLDLARLAERHELPGGTILNVVRHACLRAAARGTRTILADDVEEGLRREALKEGRAL